MPLLPRRTTQHGEALLCCKAVLGPAKPIFYRFVFLSRFFYENDISFLIPTQVLLAHLRSQGKIVLPTAFPGVAAQLLAGGMTFHKCTGLPVPTPLDQTECRLSPKNRALLFEARIIIIDEVRVSPLHAMLLSCHFESHIFFSL